MDNESEEKQETEEPEDNTIYTDDIPLNLGCNYFPAKLSASAIVNMRTKKPIKTNRDPEELDRFLSQWNKERKKK